MDDFRIDFDTFGAWNTTKLSGPAVHVPEELKNIAVTQYRIEWLNGSTPEECFYGKNHIVAVVVFAESQQINGSEYASALISMELGPAAHVTQITPVRCSNSIVPIGPILTYT